MSNILPLCYYNKVNFIKLQLNAWDHYHDLSVWVDFSRPFQSSHPLFNNYLNRTFYPTNDSSHFHFQPSYTGISMRSNGLSLVRHWASWEALFSRCIFPCYLSWGERTAFLIHSSFPWHFTVTLHGSVETRGYGYAKILGLHEGLYPPSF